MRIGISFDLAPTGPSPPPSDGPDDQFEEFDKPETVEAIASVLRGRGHEVTLLGDGPEFLRRVLDDPPELVWNIAEGQGVGRSREARVPAALEMLGIPYTGSDPLTLAATLDKDVAKRLVASDGAVKVPDGRALYPWMERHTVAEAVGPLFARSGGPVLLKPSFEGSSKGIRAHCLARSVDEVWAVYRELSTHYRQMVIVEEFIRGEEITVGLLGNVDAGNVETIGAMRVVPKGHEDDFIYSLEVKRDWKNRVRYEAPPRELPRSSGIDSWRRPGIATSASAAATSPGSTSASATESPTSSKPIPCPASPR